MQPITSTIACFISAVLISSAATGAELAGTWTLNIDTPRGMQHPTLVIEDTQAGYSGVYNSLNGPIEVDTIEREGDTFAFPLRISVPIGDIDVNYSGTIDGTQMTGSVVSPRGTVPFTGTRTAD